jgi:hypothetical protein
MIQYDCLQHVNSLSISDFVPQGELEEALQKGLINPGLRDSGVCVVRGAGGDRQLVESCLVEARSNLEMYLSLPGPMSAAKQKRHFMSYCVRSSSSAAAYDSSVIPHHRRDFVLPISANVRALCDISSVLVRGGDTGFDFRV